MRVIDLDWQGHRSWQSVLQMLLELCDRRADITFGVRQIGTAQVPTLEVRLDNPAGLSGPERLDGGADRWQAGTVLLAGEQPHQLPEGRVWLLRESGAGAVIYRAFRQAVEMMEPLRGELEFSWSSVPLSPVCDDVELTHRREALCYSYGAIHTLWVRSRSELALKERLRQLPPCGQLQVQNMATANTWIIPQEEDRLLPVFQAEP